MNIRHPDAHAFIMLALQQRLLVAGVELELLDPIGRAIARLKLPGNLFHTGERVIVYKLEVPVRGRILVHHVELVGGAMPSDDFARMDAALGAAWASIGGPLKDIA